MSIKRLSANLYQVGDVIVWTDDGVLHPVQTPTETNEYWHGNVVHFDASPIYDDISRIARPELFPPRGRAAFLEWLSGLEARRLAKRREAR